MSQFTPAGRVQPVRSYLVGLQARIMNALQ